MRLGTRAKRQRCWRLRSFISASSPSAGRNSFCARAACLCDDAPGKDSVSDLMKDTLIDDVKFDARGLVPAIVQDAVSGEVLMLAYMNAESLAKTLATGETWFWSRSRRTLWHKGETSGNTQRVVSVAIDCDGDTLLVRVTPAGPACHTGAQTCFFRPLDSL